MKQTYIKPNATIVIMNLSDNITADFLINSREGTTTLSKPIGDIEDFDPDAGWE